MLLMEWVEVLSIVLGSGIASSLVTHILTKRKRGIEDEGAEDDVLMKEIQFLTERQNMLNTQLNDAMKRELEHMGKISELSATIDGLKREIEKLKNSEHGEHGEKPQPKPQQTENQNPK